MSEMQKAGPTPGTGPHQNAAADNHSTPSDAAVRAAVSGYAVLVDTGEGRYRRRLFLTLASAERAVDRARDRGKYAYLVLVTLTPTAVIS